MSVHTSSGNPWVAKILSNLVMTCLVVVDFMISISGNLGYASVKTSNVSPVVYAPKNPYEDAPKACLASG